MRSESIYDIYDCLSFLQPEQADILPVFSLPMKHPQYHGYTIVRNPEKPSVCMFLLLRRLPHKKTDAAGAFEMFGFEDVPLTLVKTFMALRRNPCAKSNTYVVGKGDYAVFVNKLLFSTYRLHRFSLTSRGCIYGNEYIFLRMDNLSVLWVNVLNRTFFRNVNIAQTLIRQYRTTGASSDKQPKSKTSVDFSDDEDFRTKVNYYIGTSAEQSQCASFQNLDNTLMNTSYCPREKSLARNFTAVGSYAYTVPKDMDVKEIWSKQHNLPANIFKTLKAKGFELISLK